MSLKPSILIAEDDSSFGMVLQSYLAINDFEVTLLPTGTEALSHFKKKNFDLCILDVMMPDMDGFTLAEQIKQVDESIPFMFLTAKSLKEDQIKGYTLGAIDYLIKPFDPEILLLKIQAILGHTFENTSKEIIHQIGNFSFDFELRNLSINGQQQKLSPKESELLQMLCEKKGGVLTREEALLKIWEEDNYFTGQSMNVHITRLRKYLKQDTEHHIAINNLHGKGFLLKVS